MTIMIVDDCQTARKLIGYYLKSRGYRVIYAENGLDALEKLGTDEIDFIVTDLNMPYMDGIELLKTLRADARWTHIPVLMVTTENDNLEKEKAYDSGADGYLVKPVSADGITDNIKSMLMNALKRGGGIKHA